MPQLDVQKVSKTDDRSLPLFEELDRLADRIRVQAYNLFSRRGGDQGHALDDWINAEREFCWPSAELAELDGKYDVKVALAGFEPSEIAVTATPRELIVKASHEHRRPSQGKEAKVRWSEFRSNDVYRRVPLPAAVDVEKVTATFKNGLLEIVAPLAKAASEPAKIEVVSS
jgi:HSP20 family molecular chaperone IbpA